MCGCHFLWVELWQLFVITRLNAVIFFKQIEFSFILDAPSPGIAHRRDHDLGNTAFAAVVVGVRVTQLLEVPHDESRHVLESRCLGEPNAAPGMRHRARSRHSRHLGAVLISGVADPFAKELVKFVAAWSRCERAVVGCASFTNVLPFDSMR